jgi:hypothetical protein
MAGTLSSVMSIAGAGFLPSPPVDIGVAVVINPALVTARAQYDAVSAITRYRAIVSAASAAYLAPLRALASANFAPLTDHMPVGFTVTDVYPAPAWDDVTVYTPPNQVSYVGEIYESTAESTAELPTNPAFWSLLLAADSYFSVIPETAAQRLLGNGDLTKFCQLFQAAVAYQQQANQLLAQLQGSSLVGLTFNPGTGGMDSITTANINQVTTNIPLLARDLLDLGQLIDLGDLDSLGLPGQLLAQIGRVSGGDIPALSQLMAQQDFTTATIRNLARGTNTLTAQEEYALYRLLLTVTDDILAQIMAVLEIRTPNITNAAELLDPRRILPRSFSTLTCPTVTALAPVYINGPESWSVNPLLEATLLNPLVTQYQGPGRTNGLAQMSRIIPADQALATKAFVRALGQIKNIAATTLPRLSQAMLAIETNTGLTSIETLTEPVPPSVQSFYESSLGQGSGPDGQLLLTDVIGSPSGRTLISGFETMTQVLSDLTASGALDQLLDSQGAYTVMENTQAGVYTQLVMGLYRVVIPGGLPGAGTYGDYATAQEAEDDAFVTGIIPATATIIAAIVAANPGPVGQAVSAQISMAQELQRQDNNITLAQISINEYPADSTSSVMSFAGNLHEYGVDVSDGGANEILTNIANLATLSGQALIASLREGRNILALQAAGIETDTQLPG